MLSGFTAIDRKGHFRNVSLEFSTLAAFLGTTPTFLKKKIRYAEVEFNAQSIGNNFRSQKLKTKKLLCSFLIRVFYFETNLIK